MTLNINSWCYVKTCLLNVHGNSASGSLWSSASNTNQNKKCKYAVWEIGLCIPSRCKSQDTVDLRRQNNESTNDDAEYYKPSPIGAWRDVTIPYSWYLCMIFVTLISFTVLIDLNDFINNCFYVHALLLLSGWIEHQENLLWQS